MHEVLARWRSLMDQGTRCLAQEQYSEAAEFFAQCISLADSLEIPEYQAFTLRLLATAHTHLRLWNQAETGFQKALAICQKISNSKGLAEALAGLASVEAGRGELEAAVLLYQQAILVYPEQSPRLRLAMLYSDLGQVHLAQELWSDAKSAYTTAKELCQKHGFAKGEGEMEILLGEVCYLESSVLDARSHFRMAASIFAQIGDFHALATALQYLAFLYYDRKDWACAVECQRRAVVLWLDQNCALEASESTYFLSKIEQAAGDLAEAEEHLDLSLLLYTKKDLGLALRLQSMALLALAKQEVAKAEDYFRQALYWFEQLEDHVRAGEVFGALGYLAEVQGKDQEAHALHKLAAEKSGGYGTYALLALRKLAESSEKRRAYLDSLTYYWQALQLARDCDWDVDELEQAIQRVSKKMRRKSKK